MRAPRELYGMPARNFAPDVILPPFRSSRHFLGPRRQGAGFAANVPRGGHLAFPLPFRALKSAVKIQKLGGHRPAPQTHAAGPHAAQRAHHSSPPLPAAQAAAAEVAASRRRAEAAATAPCRVGWVRRMNLTEPHRPSGSSICELSSRARPSQHPHARGCRSVLCAAG